MWILKKINNSCALARDNSGKDVVVFGKGIGFKPTPYELTDLSLVDRTFYDVGGSAIAALSDIPQDVVMLAADVVDYAFDLLDLELNPNLPITLADHINFAITRAKGGIEISAPLAFDILQLYPKESRVGKRALSLVKSRLGVELPRAEQTNIALHIIDAEVEKSDMNATIITAKVIDAVTRIVGKLFKAPDPDSFAYARFATHLRFLVGRMLASHEVADDKAPMLDELKRAYPEAYRCVEEIMTYLSTEWGWECGENEALYLLVHVQRLNMD